MRTTTVLAIAALAACGLAPAAGAGATGADVPTRVDDFPRGAAERTWVNYLHRGSPRVDDFNATPVSDAGDAR